MGHNEHIMPERMRCDKCGEVDDWDMWNEVALARYSGAIGEKLGLDVSKANRCPACGHPSGTPADDDEEWGDDDDD